MATFRDAPEMSNFAQENVPNPPTAILDTDLPHNLGTKRTQARRYLRSVKARSVLSENITLEDEEEAHDFVTAVEVAALVPSIARHVTTINNADILQNFNAILTRLGNSTANEDGDTLVPPPNATNAPPIPALPTTVLALRTLEDPLLSEVESFYGIVPGPDATLHTRRRAVQRVYGIRTDNNLPKLLARSENSTANEDGDTLVPPPNAANAPPIPALPTTVLALRTLEDSLLSEVEFYYGIVPGPDATLHTRRRAVQRVYGIRGFTTTALVGIL